MLPIRLGVAVTAPIALLFVLPSSYALYRLVERPADRWRQAFTARRTAAASIRRAMPIDGDAAPVAQR